MGQSSSTSEYLKGISCPTTATCYAVGDTGVIRKTTDGGSSWSAQSSGVPQTRNLEDVSCPTTSTCYAVGSDGTITATTNGGSTWSMQSTGTLQNLYAVSCPTTSTCYAVGLPGAFAAFLKTTNGGSSWSALPEGFAYWTIEGVSCPTTSTCYLVSEGSFIRKTTDGGASSRSQISGITGIGTSLDAVSCPTTSICYAVGSAQGAGQIRSTIDGGATAWITQPAGTLGSLEGVSCPTTSICYAVGGGSVSGGTIVATRSSGASWTTELSGTSRTLLDVSCPTDDECWAVGTNGTILHRVTAITDPTLPETTADSGPPAWTKSPDATFSFSSPSRLPGITFECRLDAGGWVSCSSPKSYSGLAEAIHLFEVRAVDLAGRPDPTPASWTWQIDTTPPETTIDSGPSGPTNNSSPSFAFSSNEQRVTFECRLDSGTWSSCSAPKSYSGLAAGQHTFEVRATDAAGNVDPTPASRSFTVDTTPPDLSDPAPAVGSDWADTFVDNLQGVLLVQSDSGSGIDSTQLEYNTATDGSTAGQWLPAQAPPLQGEGDVSAIWDSTEVADGLHRVRATARDRAGNTRQIEWQAVFSGRRRECPRNDFVRTERRCYGGLDLYDGAFRPGNGVRGEIRLPGFVPKGKGFSGNSMILVGGKFVEGGTTNHNCPDRPSNGRDHWYSFAQLQSEAGNVVASPCYARLGDSENKSVAVVFNPKKRVAYVEIGGNVKAIAGRKRVRFGNRTFFSQAYGETDNFGREIGGKFANVQILSKETDRWRGPSLGDTLRIDRPQDGPYHSEIFGTSNNGHGPVSSGNPSFFCVHGPSRGCTPPSP